MRVSLQCQSKDSTGWHSHGWQWMMDVSLLETSLWLWTAGPTRDLCSAVFSRPQMAAGSPRARVLGKPGRGGEAFQTSCPGSHSSSSAAIYSYPSVTKPILDTRREGTHPECVKLQKICREILKLPQDHRKKILRSLRGCDTKMEKLIHHLYPSKTFC